jgi:hypothetical protein
MADGITINGLDQLAAKLSVYAEDMNHAVSKGMAEFAGEIEAESVKLTPIDTGELRSRSYIHGPLYDSKNQQYTMVVGYEKDTPAENSYAVQVHEYVEVHHDVGQAKFLETAFETKQPEYLPFIKQIIKESTRA